jgi:hypothetical protein
MKKPYNKPVILRKEKMKVVFAACNMDPPTIADLCIGLMCPTSCYQGTLVSTCSVAVGPCNSSFE